MKNVRISKNIIDADCFMCTHDLVPPLGNVFSLYLFLVRTFVVRLDPPYILDHGVSQTSFVRQLLDN